MIRRRRTSSADRLIKKQVALYLEPKQAEALKDLSTRTRIPQQTYLREAVDHLLKIYEYKGGKKP